MRDLCGYLDMSKGQELQAERHCLDISPVDSMSSAHNVALLSLAEDLPQVYPRNNS